MPSINTSKFGDVSYNESDVITFVRTILGFEDLTRYFVISRPESEPLKWLQSVDDPSVCFVIVDPLLILRDYSVEVSPFDIKQLEGSDNLDDYKVYVIVTIPKGRPELMSINLQGPIVINVRQLKAIQLVLNDTKYSVQHNVLEAQGRSNT